MTLGEAVRIVGGRYGFREKYVNESGKMIYVVNAERELGAMPVVTLPGAGIELFAPDVIELALGATTIEALTRRRNPELFQ